MGYSTFGIEGMVAARDDRTFGNEGKPLTELTIKVGERTWQDGSVHPQYVKATLFGDDCGKVANITEGMMVHVAGSIVARERQSSNGDTYWTNNERVESVLPLPGGNRQQPAPAPQTAPAPQAYAQPAPQAYAPAPQQPAPAPAQYAPQPAPQYQQQAAPAPQPAPQPAPVQQPAPAQQAQQMAAAYQGQQQPPAQDVYDEDIPF